MLAKIYSEKSLESLISFQTEMEFNTLKERGVEIASYG